MNGGIDHELRTMSCQTLSAMPFDGYAIGGSLGKTQDQMIEMLSYLVPMLPKDKPNHLLGIGDVSSIDQCIPLGIDTFDSSHPTRSARHGTLFTKTGMVKIGNSSMKHDFEPIEKGCSCFTCKHYTRAYLQHLFKAKEMTGYSLASIHNLHFMVQMMADYRQKILKDEI